MSWFTKIFSEQQPKSKPAQTPSRLYRLPDIGNARQGEAGARLEYDAQKAFEYFKIQWGRRFNEEALLLKNLNLPIPTLTGNFSYQLDFTESALVHIYLPNITIPLHYNIIAPLPLALERGNLSVLDKLMVYCITGFDNGAQLTEQDVAYFKERYEERGLYDILDVYSGQWFNREPYEFFKVISRHKGHEALYHHGLTHSQILAYLRILTGQDTSILNADATPLQPKPLFTVRGYSVEDARQFQRRLNFYNALDEEGKFYSPIDYYNKNYLAPGMIDFKYDQNVMPLEIFSSLHVPEPKFSDQLFTLKLIPAMPLKPAATHDYLESLRSIAHPIAFELIDTSATAYFQLTADQADRPLIERQMQLYFPECTVIEFEQQSDTPQLRGIDARPQKMYQATRSLSDFAIDPFGQFFSVVQQSHTPEVTSFQVLFFPLPNELLHTVIQKRDHHIASKLERKLPAWQATIRLYSSSKDILERLTTSFLGQYGNTHNAWTIEESDTNFNEREMVSWTLLSTTELAGLVHLPKTELKLDRLETASMKSKLPPNSYTSGETIIGQSEARGITKVVTIPDAVRDRHLYVVGKSGSGKSTLIFNIARQDIERGAGVAVIDPHGDLVEDLLNHVPEHRINDAIYFDARDYQHPIALNVMDAESEEEIGLLADDLLVTFNRLSEAGAERMGAILRYVFHTLLRARDTSFLDIQRLLQDSAFRERIVRQLQSPELIRFWSETFPRYSKDATLPIINRMSKFVLSPALSGILSQNDSLLSFYDVIQNNKILLVNLSKGKIGDDNAKLLGSLIVSQLQLAIMRRANISKEDRTPFYLFVDEFQNFTTSAFDTILSEARKYKLCLTLAHQYTSQLDEHTRDAILGNVGTLIMFEIFEKDANYLRSQLGCYEPKDLTELSAARHEALCKPQTGSGDTFKFTTLAPPPVGRSFAKEVIEHTRKNYSSTSETGSPTLKAEHRREPKAEPREAQQRRRAIKQPAQAIPKQFASTGDQISYFVGQAEYLSTQQIIALCYGETKDRAKAPAASRDLSKLITARQLRALVFGKGKIYFSAGRRPNPTSHNLAVRDLYVKIIKSDYEVTEAKFFTSQNELSPDLIITFLAEDGSLIKTFWEYDTGTESVPVLQRKVTNYKMSHPDDPVTFIFASRQRLEQVARSIQGGNVRFAVLEEFQTLKEPVFQYAGEESQTPFF